MVEAYSDNGLSASKAGAVRPGFNRMVADLALGHTDKGNREWDYSRLEPVRR